MVAVPQNGDKPAWNPPQMAPAPVFQHSGVDTGLPIAKADGPSVPRKAISLGDFNNVKRDVDESKDYLYVPKELIPDGIVVEWKRTSVLNKPDPKHAAEIYRAGWRPIPSNSTGFAEHFASFIKSDVIEYEGLVLHYRPKSMSDAAKKEEDRKAGALVQDKMEEIGLTTSEKDMPGKRYKLERGYEERLPGGNPAAVSVPE